MKKHQFEEMTASFSIIITLLAYKFEIDWLFYIYLCKSIFDTWCALKYSYISAKNDKK
ncbi:MAG: hypothetical protein IIC76_14040 [Bacteroidetes bacterium]|nr:hypothetical protein [Bacteroidota bacterium]